MKKKQPFTPCRVFAICLLFLFHSCTKHASKEVRDNLEQRNRKCEASKATSLRTSLFSSDLRSAQSVQVSDISYLNLPVLRTVNGDIKNFDVCAVNFTDNQGFVIMTTGDINLPIAVVDQGNFHLNQAPKSRPDSAVVSMIKFALQDLVELKPHLPTSPREYTYDRHKIDSLGFDVIELIEHKTRTRWGQKSPYFRGKGKHPYAGCVAMALAQVFVYYKTIDKEINGRKIDWKGLEDESLKNNGKLLSTSPQSLLKDIHEVVSWIGVYCGATYKDNGTSMSSLLALRLAESNGFSCIPNMIEYNVSKANEELKNNRLVYVEGFRKNQNSDPSDDSNPLRGHAWLVDGYAKVKERASGQTFEMVHVNWGWNGQQNGFYYANSFKVDFSKNAPIPTDGQLRNDQIRDYKYDIKMTHIYPSRR